MVTNFWDNKYDHYANKYREQVLAGYLNKEKYEKLLTNLENLWLGRSVAEEIYNKLRKEYAANLLKEKKRIGYVKGQATVRITECNRSIEEIDREILSFETRNRIGEYSVEEFNKQTDILIQQKQLFESTIRILKDIHGAKSLRDVEILPILGEKADVQKHPIGDIRCNEKPPLIAYKHSGAYEPAAGEQASARKEPSFTAPQPDVKATPIFKQQAAKIATKKRDWRKLAIIVLAAIVAIDLVIWGLMLIIGRQKSLAIGDHAPNFTLSDIDGKPISLQDFAGKQVVLYIWYQCPPCNRELPDIQSLSTSSDGRIIRFLTINTLDSRSALIDFINKNGYSFPVLLDVNNSISRQYNLQNRVPQTITVDANGNIRNMKVGAFQNNEELKRFVGEGLPSQWVRDIQATPPPVIKDNVGLTGVHYVLPGGSGGPVLIDDAGGISYPKDNICRIDFVGTTSQKYAFYYSMSCGVRNTATVGWEIYLVSCPEGGNGFVTARSDEITLDGNYGYRAKIPISIDGSAPEGTYLFKVVFYKK